MISKTGVLLLVLVGTVCVPAKAVTITNGATTVFSDGFESYAVGGDPGSPWLGGPVVPGATVSGLVDNSTSPGAFEGLHYLRLDRQSATPGNSVTFTNQASGSVKLSLMAQTGPGGDNSFIALNDGGSLVVEVAFSGHETWMGPAGLYYYTPATGFVNSGLAWTDDVWKKLDIEYAPGASTATITVDGVSSSSAAVATSSLNRLDLGTFGGFGTELIIDAVGAAVPERGSIVLTVLGAAIALTRSRLRK